MSPGGHRKPYEYLSVYKMVCSKCANLQNGAQMRFTTMDAGVLLGSCPKIGQALHQTCSKGFGPGAGDGLGY